MEIVPACGHFPWVESPGALRHAVERFLVGGGFERHPLRVERNSARHGPGDKRRWNMYIGISLLGLILLIVLLVILL